MKTTTALAGSLLLTLTGLLAPVAAWSQSTKPSAASSDCDARQDTAACTREKGAARQEAARGGLTQPGASAEANATTRCQALPANEQADCNARIRGSGNGGTTTTSGSVMGGGVIRETVTPVPAPSR